MKMRKKEMKMERIEESNFDFTEKRAISKKESINQFQKAILS